MASGSCAGAYSDRERKTLDVTRTLSSVSLLDGRRVDIRRAAASDRDAIRDFFSGLSPASLRWRFFGAPRRLNDRLIDQLVMIAPGRSAYLAVPAGRERSVVALAGYVHVPAEASCEISVAVADTWQGVRLGTLLLLAVLEDARTHGFRHFHAEVLADNVRMLGLLRELTVAFRTRVEAGVVRIEFELPAETEQDLRRS